MAAEITVQPHQHSGLGQEGKETATSRAATVRQGGLYTLGEEEIHTYECLLL